MFFFTSNNNSNNINNNNINNNNKQKKKVRFMSVTKVILIPLYKEICDCDEIWWSQIDKFHATMFMHTEINTLLRINPYMNKRQAIQLLYQPENINIPCNFYQI